MTNNTSKPPHLNHTTRYPQHIQSAFFDMPPEHDLIPEIRRTAKTLLWDDPTKLAKTFSEQAKLHETQRQLLLLIRHRDDQIADTLNELKINITFPNRTPPRERHHLQREIDTLINKIAEEIRGATYL